MSRSVRALRLAVSIAAVLLITVAYSLLVRVNPTTVALSYVIAILAIATGGPGSSGILSADAYLGSYSAEVLRHRDVVFFDQRGIGRSGGNTCPDAVNAYRLSDASIEAATAMYARAGVAELRRPGLLPFVEIGRAHG